MDRKGIEVKKEFDKIVDKNIAKWSKLNRWLATERLGKQMIKEKSS